MNEENILTLHRYRDFRVGSFYYDSPRIMKQTGARVARAIFSELMKPRLTLLILTLLIRWRVV